MADEAHGVPLISGTEMRARVEHAVVVERFLRRLGWTVLALAIVGLVVTVLLWALGEIGLEQALGAVFGVAITSILSGAGTYAAGVNVGLGASRLVLAMKDEDD